MRKGQTKHWRSGPPSQSPGTEVLTRLYVEDKLSLADIGSRYGVSKTAVSRWLRAASIPSRSISEGTRLAWDGPTEKQRETGRQTIVTARRAITPESHAKISATKKGTPAWNKGQPWSEEIRATHAAYRRDPEYRERIAEANRRAKPRTVDRSEIDLRLKGWRWRELRRQVYERDKWLCQECGIHCTSVKQNNRTARIQCHHIVARRDGGPDEMDNLVTLCMSCHMKREWRENRRSTKE